MGFRFSELATVRLRAMTAVTISGVEYHPGAELFTTPDIAESLVFNKVAVIDKRESVAVDDETHSE